MLYSKKNAFWHVSKCLQIDRYFKNKDSLGFYVFQKHDVTYRCFEEEKKTWITCESFYKSALQVGSSHHVQFRDCYVYTYTKSSASILPQTTQLYNFVWSHLKNEKTFQHVPNQFTPTCQGYLTRIQLNLLSLVYSRSLMLNTV